MEQEKLIHKKVTVKLTIHNYICTKGQGGIRYQ